MFCVWILLSALMSNTTGRVMENNDSFLNRFAPNASSLSSQSVTFLTNPLETKGHYSGLVCSSSIMSLPAFWLDYDYDCLKAKNMVSVEYSVRCPRICYHFFSKHPSTAVLAPHQDLQSCTLSLKESRRAQPMTANSQHLVQAGAVRSYHRDRSIAVVDTAWQLVPSDC